MVNALLILLVVFALLVPTLSLGANDAARQAHKKSHMDGLNR